MEHDSDITPGMVLRGLRPPVNGAGDAAESEFAETIAARLADRCGRAHDAGVLQRLANIVFLPRNPLNPRERRKLQPEAAIITMLLLGVGALVAFFNTAAAGGTR